MGCGWKHQAGLVVLGCPWLAQQSTGGEEANEVATSLEQTVDSEEKLSSWEAGPVGTIPEPAAIRHLKGSISPVGFGQAVDDK